MLANLGFYSILLAFGCALYAVVMAAFSWKRRERLLLASARQAALLTLPLLTLASILLVTLLIQGDYNVEYVYSASNREMPFYLKVTALWGGQAGSLLFWSWLMSVFTTSALLGRWERDLDSMPVVIIVMMVTLGFFISLVMLFENPFVRFWQGFDGGVISSVFPPTNSIPFVPENGRGLNPLLRHLGMIIHPPMLYLGFVGFVVPYAFAIAALVNRRVDAEWLRTTRRWTVIGWLFLSLGLILGGRWAYDVLGWGGFWGWDPVENAALMPWLTGTAFLHSSMIQEKRGMLKRWNMILIMLTYSLVIFGTFLTRSGVLSSVHSFAQSAIGPAFFAFIAFTFIASMLLLARQWEHLRDENQLEGMLSRESAFLLNNLLFIGIAVSVFWGTVYPLISELATNQKVTVGPPFYNQVTGPQFLGLLLLMGVAPLLAWRKASAKALGKLTWLPIASGLAVAFVCYLLITPGEALIEFSSVTIIWLGSLVVFLPGFTTAGWMCIGVGTCIFATATTVLEFVRGTQARMRTTRENALTALFTLMARNRRRYGGYIIHLGVVVMAIGIIGATLFQSETQGRLNQGQQLTLGRYTMRFEDVMHFTHTDGREVHRATVSVFRDGQFLTLLHPRRDIYELTTGLQPMTIPGVRSSLEDDVYVLLVDWEPVGVDGATFKVYVNPLINWVWAGGLIFILGTLVAVWPTTAESRRTLTSSATPALAGD